MFSVLFGTRDTAAGDYDGKNKLYMSVLYKVSFSAPSSLLTAPGVHRFKSITLLMVV